MVSLVCQKCIGTRYKAVIKQKLLSKLRVLQGGKEVTAAEEFMPIA